MNCRAGDSVVCTAQMSEPVANLARVDRNILALLQLNGHIHYMEAVILSPR